MEYQDEVSVAQPKVLEMHEPDKVEPNQLVENPFVKRTEQSAVLNTNAGNVWSESPPSQPISKTPIVSSPDMALPHPRKNSVKNNHPLLKKLSSSDRDQQMPNMIFLKQLDSKTFNEAAHKELNTSIATKSTDIADRQCTANKKSKFQAYSSPVIEKDLKRIDNTGTTVNTVFENNEEPASAGYRLKCCFII